MYSNHQATKKKNTKKNIWLHFTPLAITTKVVVKKFQLNKKDKCIKGNGVT
jgi:hypothetical protein